MVFTFAAKLAGRVANVLGMLAIMSILARRLVPPDFASFLLLYTQSSVFAAFTDGGARHTLFLRLQGAGSSESARVLLRDTTTLKRIESVLVVVPYAFFCTWNGIDFDLSLVGGLVAYWMVASDLNLIALRAIGTDYKEPALLFAEQLGSVSCILAYVVVTDSPSPVVVLWIILAFAVARSLGAKILLAQDLGLNIASLLKYRDFADLKSHINFKDIRIALENSLGEFLLQFLLKLPALTWFGRIDSHSYNALVSFLNLLVRGDIVIAAFAHTHVRLSKSAQINVRIVTTLLAEASVLAVGVVAACQLFSQQITRLWLGAAYGPYFGILQELSWIVIIVLPMFVFRLVLQMEGRAWFASCGYVAGVLAMTVTARGVGFSHPFEILWAGFSVSLLVLFVSWWLTRARQD